MQVARSGFGSQLPFYDWAGIIRANWDNRPAVIQSTNHWVNAEVVDVATRHSLIESAVKRYDALRLENNDCAANIFTADLTQAIADAKQG